MPGEHLKAQGKLPEDALIAFMKKMIVVFITMIKTKNRGVRIWLNLCDYCRFKRSTRPCEITNSDPRYRTFLEVPLLMPYQSRAQRSERNKGQG